MTCSPIIATIRCHMVVLTLEDHKPANASDVTLCSHGIPRPKAQCVAVNFTFLSCSELIFDFPQLSSAQCCVAVSSELNLGPMCQEVPTGRLMPPKGSMDNCGSMPPVWLFLRMPVQLRAFWCWTCYCCVIGLCWLVFFNLAEQTSVRTNACGYECSFRF